METKVKNSCRQSIGTAKGSKRIGILINIGTYNVNVDKFDTRAFHPMKKCLNYLEILNLGRIILLLPCNAITIYTKAS